MCSSGSCTQNESSQSFPKKCVLWFEGKVVASAFKSAGLCRQKQVRMKSMLLVSAYREVGILGIGSWNIDPAAIAGIQYKGMATGIKATKCNPFDV